MPGWGGREEGGAAAAVNRARNFVWWGRPGSLHDDLVEVWLFEVAAAAHCMHPEPQHRHPSAESTAAAAAEDLLAELLAPRRRPILKHIPEITKSSLNSSGSVPA